MGWGEAPASIAEPWLALWPRGVLSQPGGTSSRPPAGTQLQQTIPYHLGTDTHEHTCLVTQPDYSLPHSQVGKLRTQIHVLG